MAISRKKSSAKPWEILGVYFGFFAVAKDVPGIFRTIRLPVWIPDIVLCAISCAKHALLFIVPSSDFWMLVIFAGTSYLVTKIAWPSHEDSENPERDSIAITMIEGGKRYEGTDDEVQNALRRTRRLRILKTFGLILLREKLLDLLGVQVYGTFKRGSNWTPAPDRWDSIDRISFDDWSGTEYQYPKEKVSLVCRSHPAGDDKFGLEETRMPKGKEFLILLLASGVFWWWLILFSLRKLAFWK